MKTLLLLILTAGLSLGQSLFSGIDNVAADPAGACAYGAGPGYFGRLRFNVTTGNLWGCVSSTWQLLATPSGTGVTSVSGVNGLTGTVTTSGSISGVDAAADGATKGVSAFTAADFDASSGVISLDYTNGQKATGSVPGYLTAANWTTFNGKTATIASGAKTLNTTAVSANTCGTVQTDTATGTLTTDAFSWMPNADITAVTGYNVAGTFGLYIYAYPTADLVNFKVCNSTSSSITPGSAITLNWRVTR